jgi:hypothetical protein
MSNAVIREPSVNEISFNCPHCGALAKQFWFQTRAKSLADNKHPSWMDAEDKRAFLADIKDPDQKIRLENLFDRMTSRRPFLQSKTSAEYTVPLHNLSVSRCYNCEEISIWIGEGMVWPNRGSVPRPNVDIPAEALRDYEEAAEIVDKSPRGAAALLRLAIQKICIHLGGKGHLNEDISLLVERGLDRRVQQSLDVVRVVGNNAVHPGELDIRDDKSVADNLFGLINLIVDIMISQPKHVDALYAGLPDGARLAIEKRDSMTKSSD